MQAAFDKLSYKEQTLLEKRNAICMTCGRVGAWEERPTFENLAVMFEGSTASGAERAYKKALDKLTGHLVDAGVLGMMELKLIEKNKKSPPLHTSTKQYIDMPTTMMNGEKYVLTFLPELRRS